MFNISRLFGTNSKKRNNNTSQENPRLWNKGILFLLKYDVKNGVNASIETEILSHVKWNSFRNDTLDWTAPALLSRIVSIIAWGIGAIIEKRNSLFKPLFCSVIELKSEIYRNDLWMISNVIPSDIKKKNEFEVERCKAVTLIDNVIICQSITPRT